MRTILSALLLLGGFFLLAQKPLLVVPTGASGGLSSMSNSVTGNFIVTCSNQQIKLWNDVGKEIRTFQAAGRQYSYVVISPDGTMIVAFESYYLEAPKAFLLDVLTGKDLLEFPAKSEPVLSAAFSPDSKKLVLTYMYGGNVEILSVPSGKILRKIEANAASTRFLPDGKQIVSNGLDGVFKIWNAETGKLVRALPVPIQNVTLSTFSVSSDGKFITVGNFNNEGVVMDIATGAVVQEFKGYYGQFSIKGTYFYALRHNMAFLYDGRDIKKGVIDSFSVNYGNYSGPPMPSALSANLLSDEKTIMLDCYGSTEAYDLQSKTLKFNLQSSAKMVTAIHPEKDFSRYLFSTGNAIREVVFDSETSWKVYSGHQEQVHEARYAGNGQYVVSTSSDFYSNIWETESGKLIHRIQTEALVYPVPGFVRHLDISPDGTTLYKLMPALKTFDVATGRPLTTILDSLSMVGNFALSNDCSLAAVYDYKNGFQLWETQTKKLRYTSLGAPLFKGGFTPDNKYLTLLGDQGRLLFWDCANFQVTDSLELNHPKVYINELAYSADGRFVALGLDNKTVEIWDITTRKRKHILSGHTGDVRVVQFSSDGKWLISSAADFTVRIWALETGKEVASLVFFGDKDWAVTTPEGLFDASPGAMQLLYFVIENEVLVLNQLKERYYEPGLLQKVMGFTDEPIRNVQAFANLPLYPLATTKILYDSLYVSLEPRNGGIGKVSLFVNQKEVVEDINLARNTRLQVNLLAFQRYCRLDTVNKITIRVYNAEGWLKSAALTLDYKLVQSKGSTNGNDTDTGIGTGNPSLYAIMIGTSNYAGEKLDLRFPDQDAAAMSAAIGAAGKALFGEKVEVITLNTSNAPGTTFASKANISAAFASLVNKVKATDIFLVYLSGHGVTHGIAEKSQFYYLTKDISSEELIDPEVRDNFAIGSNELTQWLTAIPALKQVMILDACNSGKVVEDLATLGKKDLNPSQIRAIDRMKDRTGTFILTGSASNKVSYEASQFGQGLLTYSLLQGMSGLALTEDRRVDVMELFQYSRDKVPDLAKGVGGIQTPQLAFPANGASFDIGIVTEAVKIPVAEEKPVFIRNNFQEEASFDDVLGLNEALATYFQGLSVKGAQSEIIYVDVSNYNNAYSMKGRYSIVGDVVKVSGKLYKGKTPLGDFVSNGKKDNINALITNMIETALGLIP